MKERFDAAKARGIADYLVSKLAPVCERIIIAGSLRRCRETVGDIEILYIPKIAPSAHGELFETPKNLADIAIEEMERAWILSRRKNAKGSEMFGEKNKLMRHKLSGIPVDFFSTTAEAWANYLVCRTGGAASNTEIATRAKHMGYKWNPYREGFTRLSDGECIPMTSEEAVFRFVSMPFLNPPERP